MKNEKKIQRRNVQSTERNFNIQIEINKNKMYTYPNHAVNLSVFS